EGAGEIPEGDDQHRNVEVAATPHGSDGQGGGHATDHAQEERGDVVDHRLLADHDGHDHGADHRHAPVEEDAEHHRHEGEDGDLGVNRNEMGHDGRFAQHESE